MSGLRDRLYRAAVAVVLSAVLALGLASSPTWADSGGYSRPSVGGSGAPAFGSSYGGGSSGGYRRPSVTSGGYGTGSAGDVSISRGASGQALQNYRALQNRRPAPAEPSGFGTGPVWNGGGPGAYARRPPPTYGSPSYGGYGASGGFSSGSGGFGSAAFWALLGAMSAADRAAYWQRYQADPAYQQWQRQALRDPGTADRLAALGDPAALAQSGSETDYNPSPGRHGGSPMVWIVVLVGSALLVLLWYFRQRTSRPGPANAAPPPAALGGSAATRFRVGQTIPFDPSPFLLAAGSTKVQPPPAGNMISIEAVGLVQDGATNLHRLYLPGRASFFQLHLDVAGRPDECRYFSTLDEVQPADAAEWGQWLDPAQGMIGWPAFQTKDGKLYGRAWSPGQARVEPRPQSETIQTLDGTQARSIQAMLYAAATGAAPPAPPTEYILVSAVEAGAQAFVEIHAGIDINPAALTLPPVPL